MNRKSGFTNALAKTYRGIESLYDTQQHQQFTSYSYHKISIVAQSSLDITMAILTVFLDKISNLADSDLAGKSDPYVKFELAQDVSRS